jgi:hypothetical protein
MGRVSLLLKSAGSVLCKDSQTTKAFVVQSEEEKLFDFAMLKDDQPYKPQNLQKDICNKRSNATGMGNIVNENKTSKNELLQKTSLQNLQDPLVFFPDYEVLVFTPITKIITVTVPFLLLLIPVYFWYKARKQKYEVINKILEIAK